MTARHDGVTLVETTVVVAMFAVLLSISLPAVQASREMSRRATCFVNLKQLGLAMHGYHSARRRLPVGSIKRQSTGTGWGWGAAILPYVEAADLFESIDFNIPTAVGRNSTYVLHRYLPISSCPSDVGPAVFAFHDQKLARGSYCGSAGSRGFFTPGVLYEMSDVRFAEISDGLSNTLMIGERVNQLNTPAGSVTSGWFGHVVTEEGFQHNSVPHLDVVAFIPVNLDREYPGCFSSYHSQGANFLMCDGSVTFVRNDLNGALYQSLGSRAGD